MTTQANGGESKSCLGRVFNFKLPNLKFCYEFDFMTYASMPTCWIERFIRLAQVRPLLTCISSLHSNSWIKCLNAYFPDQSCSISCSRSYGRKIVHNSAADPTFQDPEWPTDPFDDYPTGEGLVNNFWSHRHLLKSDWLMVHVLNVLMLPLDARQKIPEKIHSFQTSGNHWLHHY